MSLYPLPENFGKTDTRIEILGGGFSGSTLATSFEKRLPENCSITLVSKDNHIIYKLLLAEFDGTSILPGHVITPLRQTVK